MSRGDDEDLGRRTFSSKVREVAERERNERNVWKDIGFRVPSDRSIGPGRPLGEDFPWVPSAMEVAQARDKEVVGLLAQLITPEEWGKLNGMLRVSLLNDAERHRASREGRRKYHVGTDEGDGPAGLFAPDGSGGRLLLSKHLLAPDSRLDEALQVFLQLQGHAYQREAVRQPFLFPEVPESTIDIWKKEYECDPQPRVESKGQSSELIPTSITAAAHGKAQRMSREIHEEWTKRGL